MNVSFDLKSKLRKMELKKHLIICWVVLLAFCSGANAISCYFCDSVKDGANCADPFVDSKEETNCTACSTWKGVVGDLKLVVRACETGTNIATGCSSVSVNGVPGDLCVCTTDLCNASSRISTATMMVILLPVSVSLFMKLFQL